MFLSSNAFLNNYLTSKYIIMSKPSIYETSWIDLVFENRNKEYGAYRLRQESAKTGIFSLFVGLLFCAALMTIPKLMNFFKISSNTVVTTSTNTIDEIVELTAIIPPVSKPSQQMPVAKATIEKPTAVIIKKQLSNPTIVKPELALNEIATNVEAISIKRPTIEGTGISSGVTNASTGSGTASTVATDYGNTTVTTAVLDKLPQFPGGMDKFYSYVVNRFRTPEVNNEKLIKIYVSFVVEKDGTMSDIKVVNNPGYGLDKEAIRVLQSMKTKWSPGMIGSKAVRTAYNLPIIVQVN